MFEMRNFLEDEDYGASPASPETLEKIQVSLYVLESSLLSPVSVPEGDIRIGELEISDDGESIFATVAADKDDSPHGIVVYKPKSEKHVMENLLGALRYWLEDDSFIDFNVYVHGIKKQYITLPYVSDMSGLSHQEAYEYMAEEAGGFLEKQKEAQAFMEMTGMDFVSEQAAKQILQALHEYENFISSTLKA